MSGFDYKMVMPTEETLKVASSNLGANITEVVFLIGWTGSQDKHLSKFSAFYEAQGYLVIRYCPSAKNMFGFDPEPVLREHASKLVQLLVNYDLETKIESNSEVRGDTLSSCEYRIFFHVFSNGGACIYYLMSKELVRQSKNLNFAFYGCVFDSSPALMTNKRTFDAIVSVVPGPPNLFWLKYLVASAAIGFLWFSYLVNRTRDIAKGLYSSWIAVNSGEMSKTEDYRLWLWYTLQEEPYRCPQLFLFSKEDPIADYRSIQQFIEVRKKLHGPESAVFKFFENTLHVQHFRKEPDEYLMQVKTFLQRCLKRGTAL